MLHIVMEIAFAAVVFVGMYAMLMSSMHEFGKIIVDSQKTIVEDWSNIRSSSLSRK